MNRWIGQFALLALLANSSTASDWARITQPTDNNTDEAALARTPDGVLHVVWLRKGGETSDYMHTAIGPDGRVLGGPSPVLTGWNTLVNPALVTTRKGELWLFFSGMRATNEKDPYSHGALYWATGDVGGARWSLRPGPRSYSENVYESDIAAVMGPNGVPAIAWTEHNGVQLHFGTEKGYRDRELELPCCAYHAGIAVDGITGDIVSGWHSNVDHGEGLLMQVVAPNERELRYVFNSATEDRTASLAIEQRMAMTGRIGQSGVYLAFCVGYPNCKSVNLWKHGGVASSVIATSPGAHHVNIAAAPDGRLWVMWANDTTLFFTRSNCDATRFGVVQMVPAPKGTQTIFKLGGEGTLGPLDVLTHAQNYPSAEIATWYTRVLPPLTFTAQEEGQKINFLVTDVGDPVVGATVLVDGKTLTTDAQGHAVLDLPAGAHGVATATASKEGYKTTTWGHSTGAGHRGPLRFMYPNVQSPACLRTYN